MTKFLESAKPLVSGKNSGLYRGRLAAVLFKQGNGITSTPAGLAIVRILLDEGVITPDFDASCLEVKKLRGLGVMKRAAAIALRDQERAKVVSAVKKKFKVDLDSPNLDIAAALERIEAKVGK